MILAMDGQVPLGWAGPQTASPGGMRSLLLVSLLTGCTVGSSDGDQANTTDPGPLEEVNGYCSCDGLDDGPCAGCSLQSGTCLALGNGAPCTAGGTGTLTMQVDGVAFAAVALVAGRWGGSLQIAATAGNDHTIILELPAEAGTYDCTTLTTKVTYFNAGRVSRNYSVQSPRPPCTITMTAAGATFEGMFAISVAGQDTHLLTSGAFSVMPVDY